jgi:hypothetical protein
MMNHCIELLKRDDFKNELKKLCEPMLEMVLDALKSHLLYVVALLLFNFIMLSSILFYVFRIKKMLSYIHEI